MKNLTLTAGQRIGIIELLGQQEGKLAQLLPYHRLANLLRITEEEGKELGLRLERQGDSLQATWDPAAQPREFAIEDADAAQLKDLLEAWPRWKPSDLTWLLPVTSALAQDVL